MFFIFWYRYWPFVVITAAVGLVFGSSLFGTFLSWDDSQHILQNPWLTQFDLGHFWRNEYYGFYIPMTYTIWAVVYAIWPSAMAFHLLNLFLHLLNTFFVYLLGRKLLASRASDAVELGERGRQTFALIAALLFALHPLQVEPVAWISGGRDLLAGFFGLAAMLVAWNTSDRLFPSWAAILRRLAASLLFAAGLLSKPVLAVLPLAIKWLSWFTERRGLKWPMMWVWLAFGGAVAGLTMEVQSGFVRDRVVQVSEWDRARVALDSLIFYFHKLYAFDSLSADYGRTPLIALSPDSTLVPSWPYLAGTVFILAVLWFLVPRAFWGGLGFFVLMLTPTLGFVGFAAQAQSTVFDRFAYLPLVGIALLVATVACESKTRLELRILGAFLVIGFLGWTSFNRVPVWRSDQTLFTDVVSKNPSSYIAWVNLGIHALDNDDLATARAHFTRALDLDAKLSVANSNLAHVAWLEKKPDEVLALTEALKDPSYMTYNRHEDAAIALLARMRGRVFWERGQAEEARESYCLASERNALDPNMTAELKAFFEAHPQLQPCPVTTP